MVTKTQTNTKQSTTCALDIAPTDEELDRARAVRALNDAFRINFSEAQLYISPNLLELSKAELESMLNAVRHYRRFSESSDPAMTHSRGLFRHEDHKVVWIIYYYDYENEHVDSPCTIDLNLTKRWMMVMTADEFWEKDLLEDFF